MSREALPPAAPPRPKPPAPPPAPPPAQPPATPPARSPAAHHHHVVLPWFHHHPVYRKILHHTRTLHTYLTMFALVMFFFFSVTGFLLNHAEWFGLDATRHATRDLALSAKVLAAHDKLTLVEYLRAEGHVTGAVQPFDLPAATDEPFHVAFKSPRVETDVDLTPADGKATVSTETRGVAGLLANLHMAQNTGLAWRFVLDATALLLFLASVTGLFLWYTLPKRRRLGQIAFAASVVLVLVVYLAFVP